jgi:hypothetical protein
MLCAFHSVSVYVAVSAYVTVFMCMSQCNRPCLYWVYQSTLLISMPVRGPVGVCVCVCVCVSVCLCCLCCVFVTGTETIGTGRAE